jgi:hypothetical protein
MITSRIGKRSKSNWKAAESNPNQLEFGFSDPGYALLVKLAIENPSDLRLIDDSSVLLDWLAMGSTELVRAIINFLVGGSQPAYSHY